VARRPSLQGVLLATVEGSVLSSFEALAGAPDRAVRFEASCHFAVARRG
jgi:hypothetical protein